MAQSLIESHPITPPPRRLSIRSAEARSVGWSATGISAAIAMLVLSGWALDIERLKRVFPNLIAMNPLTAVMFLAASVGLWLQYAHPAASVHKWVARVLSVVVLFIGVLLLQVYVTGWDTRLDRLLFANVLGTNRLSPNTAVCFLLSGTALLLASFVNSRNAVRIAQLLAVCVWIAATLALLGYAYGARTFYQALAFIPMALHTAIGFLLLSTGILCLHPDRGVMALVLSATAGGSLIRSFLPAVMLVPAILGWCLLVGERAGLFDVPTAFSVYSVSIVAIFSVLVWANGSLLRRIDLRRRSAEGALLQERTLLRQLIDNLPDHIYIKDSTGHYITDNISHAQFVGADSPDQVIGKTVHDLFPSAIAKAFAADDEKVLVRGQTILAREEKIVDHQGKPGWVATTKVPMTDARGQISGIVCISRDISHRKQIEQEMQEMQDFLSSIIENLPNMVFVKDATDLRFVRLNRAGEELLAVKREDMVGRNDYDLFPKVEADFFTSKDRAVLSSGQMLDIPYEPIDTPRGRRILHTKKIPIIVDGKPRYLLGISDDITEREMAERMMRESEEQTRLTVETALDAFVSMSEDGRIIGWNAQSERTFGWPRAEAIGKNLAGLIVPERYRQAHANGMARYFETGQGNMLGQRIEISSLHRDGHEFPVEMTIAPLRIGGKVVFNAFIHDITARKRTEQELEQTVRSERAALDQLQKAQSAIVQSEKLASLGQLVAGVAHEINNPLSFVSNNLAVLQRDLAAVRACIELYRQGDPILQEARPELMTQILELSDRIDLNYTLANLDPIMLRSRDGLKRIEQIVKDLRDFARLDESDLQELDLNVGVKSTLNIIRGQAKGRNIGLIERLHPLPMISGYPAKLNQVVLNLLTNAIDASSDGGKISIETTLSADGDSVLLSVCDDGAGIAPDVRPRIFDPFFTTKKQGEGTGLGLSISYGIVQDHGGTIDVQSEIGKGSTFTVRLPVHPTAAPSA